MRRAAAIVAASLALTGARTATGELPGDTRLALTNPRYTTGKFELADLAPLIDQIASWVTRNEAPTDSCPPGRYCWSEIRTCISNHESINAGYYNADTGNGAYGAYQFRLSTSRVVAGWIGHPELAELPMLPANGWSPYRQEQAGAALWNNSGLHWHGTNCPGT